jgi:hypothetical protein
VIVVVAREVGWTRHRYGKEDDCMIMTDRNVSFCTLKWLKMGYFIYQLTNWIILFTKD